MSSIFKKFANDDEQPSNFEFSSENKKKASQIIKQYPKNYKESCIMPFLTLAQNQCGGWIPKKAMEYISGYLNVSEMSRKPFRFIMRSIQELIKVTKILWAS